MNLIRSIRRVDKQLRKRAASLSDDERKWFIEMCEAAKEDLKCTK